jgi:hypothetical protein
MRGLMERRLYLISVAMVVAGGLFFACAHLLSRQDSIIFSHEKHAKEEGIGCEECHEEGAQKAIPKEEKCLECHEKAEGKCAQCHKNPKNPQTWQEARLQGLRFSHETHKEVECQKCHKDVLGAKRPSDTETPRMLEVCMSCHRKDFRSIDCKKCHEDMVENPARPTRLFSHDVDFEKRHGLLAKGDERVCAHCHREEFCGMCHSTLDVLPPDIRFGEKVEAGLIHRHDFITRHSIEARQDPNKCMECHRVEQCSSCHQKRKAGGHEPDFMNPSSPNFHGRQARADILACAACHDAGAQSNCVRCHRVGGAGGSPHPAGFKGDKSHGVCRACHQ